MQLVSSYIHMQSTITPAEGSLVKIVMDIDEVELEPNITVALNKISKDVRIPGFRQGKVPRKVLEAKLGKSYIRAEALNEAIPNLLNEAIRTNDLDAIATQDVKVISGEDTGPLVVEAEVQLRPEVDIPGYLELEVVVPSPYVTDKDVSDQIKRLREQFGELNEVTRPIVEDDQVTIDVKAERDGEPVAGLSVDDFLYRVGGDSFIPGLDAAITGHSTGDEASLEIAPPEGSELSAITAKVAIKKVSELVLPELNDEWASEASEFDTLAELEESIRSQIDSSKKSRVRMVFRDKAISALVDIMEPKEIPQVLAQNEFDRLVHDFSHRLEAQGIALEQYLSVTGTSSDQLVSQILADAEVQAKADLALRALVKATQVEIESDELEKEISAYAENSEVDLELFREQITANGQIKMVELEMAKSKALEKFLDGVRVVDEEGNVIDRELLKAEQEEVDSDEEASSASSSEADSSSGGEG